MKTMFGDSDLKKMDLGRKYGDDDYDMYEGVSKTDYMLLWFIAFILFVFIVWANFATLEEVTRGEGRVIPSSEIQVIQNLEGGIIDAFLVKEGDTVQEGDILVRMRNVQATADFSSNYKRFLGIKAIVQRLQAESEGKPEVGFDDDVRKGVPESVSNEVATFQANMSQFRSQLGVLEQQLSQKKQEVSELQRRISDISRVLSLSDEEMAMLKPAVDRGAAPRMELLQLERSIAERRAELNGLRLALPRSRAAVVEAEQRIAEHKSTARANAQRELAERIVEMNSIKETLGALEDRKSRTEIRSPVFGTVKDIKISTVGGVVQPAEPIMEIVPLEDTLLVEAQIKPSDIAFLYPGQKATVKVTAYDYTVYGGLEGEVVDISADTITNPEGESFYRVRVQTQETSMEHRGETLNIIPGMTTQVDILTGEKTVMDYLLKPFKKASQNALRER